MRVARTMKSGPSNQSGSEDLRMFRTQFICALTCLFLVACVDTCQDEATAETTGDDKCGADGCTAPPPPPATTPLACDDDFVNGQTLLQFPEGAGAVGMQSNISVDAFGNIMFSKEQHADFDFYGVIK